MQKFSFFFINGTDEQSAAATGIAISAIIRSERRTASSVNEWIAFLRCGTVTLTGRLFTDCGTRIKPADKEQRDEREKRENYVRENHANKRVQPVIDYAENYAADRIFVIPNVGDIRRKTVSEVFCRRNKVCDKYNDDCKYRCPSGCTCRNGKSSLLRFNDTQKKYEK